MHLPYWAKKGMPGIKIMPLHSYSADMIEKLTQTNKELAQLAVGGTGEAISSAGGTGEASSSAGGEGGKGGKGGGKGNKTVQKRGGNLPKLAKLIKAIQQEDWQTMYALTDEYMSDTFLAYLVEKQ